MNQDLKLVNIAGGAYSQLIDVNISIVVSDYRVPNTCGHSRAPLWWSTRKLHLYMGCFAAWWESFPAKETFGFAFIFKTCALFCTTHNLDLTIHVCLALKLIFKEDQTLNGSLI